MRLPQPRLTTIRRPYARNRRGALILELVVVLPILLIVLLAVVQFGLYFQNMQQVSLAARVGAETASQTANLPSENGMPVPLSIRRAVEQQLASSGIRCAAVRVEHNSGGQPVVLRWPVVDSGFNLTTLDAPPPGRYVRVTVLVPTNELMPNSLEILGLNLAGPEKRTGFTNTFRYELD